MDFFAKQSAQRRSTKRGVAYERNDKQLDRRQSNLTGYGETQVLLPDIRAASAYGDGIVRRGLDAVRRGNRYGRNRLGDLTPRRHGVGTDRNSDSEARLQRRNDAGGGEGRVGGAAHRDPDAPVIPWPPAVGRLWSNKVLLFETSSN